MESPFCVCVCVLGGGVGLDIYDRKIAQNYARTRKYISEKLNLVGSAGSEIRAKRQMDILLCIKDNTAFQLLFYCSTII